MHVFFAVFQITNLQISLHLYMCSNKCPRSGISGSKGIHILNFEACAKIYTLL